MVSMAMAVLVMVFVVVLFKAAIVTSGSRKVDKRYNSNHHIISHTITPNTTTGDKKQ